MSGKIALAMALGFSVIVDPVFAQDMDADDPDDTPIIWNDLHQGMSKAEVKALYPKGYTPIADGCFAAVDGDFEQKRLARVNLEWSVHDTSKRCGEIITATLFEKYGEPTQTDVSVVEKDCGYGKYARWCRALVGDQPDVYTYAKWVKGGIEIVLKRQKGDESTWWMVYRPVAGADDTAAAKL